MTNHINVFFLILYCHITTVIPAENMIFLLLVLQAALEVLQLVAAICACICRVLCKEPQNCISVMVYKPVCTWTLISFLRLGLFLESKQSTFVLTLLSLIWTIFLQSEVQSAAATAGKMLTSKFFSAPHFKTFALGLYCATMCKFVTFRKLLHQETSSIRKWHQGGVLTLLSEPCCSYLQEHLDAGC